MKVIEHKIVAIAMIAGFFIQTVRAAEPANARWYGDLAAGKTSLQKSYPGSSSRSGASWNLDIGYKIFRYLGLELGYTRYSNSNITTSDGVPATDTLYSYNISARGILPVWKSGLELYGKLGVGKLNSNVTVNGSTATPINNQNNYVTSAFLGAGVQYYLLPNLAVGALWSLASGNKEVGRVQFYGLSAAVLFG